MLVLLPPSETKRIGGSGILDPHALRAATELARARKQVQQALESLSADPVAAAKPLKLGVKNQSELQHNLQLSASGVLPAIERYTGVLYDALAVSELAPEARTWLDRHVLVQSALFGLVGAGDPIPAYRLSAGSRLPALGGSLKAIWQSAHESMDWYECGWVLDLRSKDYAALAPLPRGVGAALQVAQRGADGDVRALNHFNKAAKGDLVRRLAQSQAEIASEHDLIAWANAEGLELRHHATTGELTLLTSLGAPNSDGPRRSVPQTG
jgi:cytoplasmic iron level regulating protein YaaA (DUF328/UPF0246 family)